MLYGRPRFEIVTPADPDALQLVSGDTIRTLTGLPSSGAGSISDERLDLLIVAALGLCARSCRLATSRAHPATLARETVKATWQPNSWDSLGVRSGAYHGIGSGFRDDAAKLSLPWRAPIISLEVTDGSAELVENTDFQLLEAGVVERLGGWFWPIGGTLVIEYVVGFTDEDGDNPLPSEIVALLADQVRLAVDSGGTPMNLRSEDIPGVWSGTFNIPGGDAIAASGLSRPLYEALGDLRGPPVFA